MKIKPDFKIRDVAGEKLVILQDRGKVDFTKVLALNSTSEWLWTQLSDRDFETEDVVKLLRSRFNVAEAKAVEDAKKWLDILTDSEIIEL